MLGTGSAIGTVFLGDGDSAVGGIDGSWLKSCMLLVTVSKRAVTSEDFEAASRSRCPRLPWLPGFGFSNFRRFGACRPQLTVLRKLLLDRDDDASFEGRGDDETISCARLGLVKPTADAGLSCLASEYRSHSSSVGSACGDFKAFASFCTFKEGGAGVSVAGDDIGEELRARFVPFRETSGDRPEAKTGWRLLSHKILSFGDTVTSSSVAGLGSTKSRQFRRAAGVTAWSVFGRVEFVASEAALPSCPSVSSYLNLLSLSFVTSETGIGGRGFGVCKPAGWLCDRCHDDL